MKKLTNRQKLDLISFLCSEKECSSKLGSKIQKFASQIYTISHPSASCPHKEWEEKAVKLAKENEGGDK